METQSALVAWLLGSVNCKSSGEHQGQLGREGNIGELGTV